jgi:hypothetical protein
MFISVFDPENYSTSRAAVMGFRDYLISELCLSADARMESAQNCAGNGEFIDALLASVAAEEYRFVAKELEEFGFDE